MKNIGQAVYNTTASYGRMKAIGGLIFGVIVSFILLCVSLYFVYVFIKYKKTTAVITGSDCYTHKNAANNSNTKNYYNCHLDVTYIVKKKEMTSHLETDSSYLYKKGQPIDIAYNKNNYDDIKFPSNLIYIVLPILFSVMIAWSSFSNYYMTKHYKQYAAAQGTFSIISDISNALQTKNNKKI